MATTDPRRKARTHPEENWWVSYDNNGEVYLLAILDITGATSFVEETISAATLPAAGAKLFARLPVNRVQTATGNLVVTVNGWEQAGSAGVTGTFTFQEHEHAEAGVEAVTTPSGKTFSGISSYSVTGGTPGEKVEIFYLPDTSTFKRLGYDPTVETTPGPKYFNVPKGYNGQDHKKRQRFMNDISLNDMRSTDGLDDANVFDLRDFRVMLINQITDDGNAYVKQLTIIEGVSVEDVPEPAPDIAGTSEKRDTVTGNYMLQTKIVAPSTTTSAIYII